MSEYQGQIKIKNLQICGRWWKCFDVLAENALEEVAIYEDMFEPSLSGKMIIKDLKDFGNDIPLVGEETLIVDIEVEDSGEILIPPLYVYNVEEIHGKDNDPVGTRYWELRFGTYGYITAKWDDIHLTEDFEGPIHEFVQKLYDGTKDKTFDAGAGKGEKYELDLEPTGNNIVYKNQYAEYSSLRKNGPRNVVELINQCAEHAVHEKNVNAANFLFWQDLYGWKFKSIESLMDQDTVKVYCETVQLDGAGEGECGLKDAQILDGSVKIIDMGNRLQLARDGMYASLMRYSPPRVDVEKNPYWMVSGIETFYYKVNCRFLDRFPAAIVGFKRTEDVHRWHYAFAEVYLTYNYDTHRPSFKFKPMSENPIRSSVEFTEDGAVNNGEAFGHPAHNTMEMGNDGWHDGDDGGQRIGWEAPGVRINTKMWEESCFKIQPIRGSAPWNMLGNNTDEDWFDVEDDFEVNWMYPVVEMKIYKDVEGQPHYFFTAENAADGECSEEEELNQGDCPTFVPEVT